MLELCKEASIDCILDDSDNSDTYLVVLFRIFNLDLFLDLSSLYMLTYQHSFKTLNRFSVRLNISIKQIFYYYKEYNFDGGIFSFYKVFVNMVFSMVPLPRQ